VPLANRGSRGSLPLALGEPPEAYRVPPPGCNLNYYVLNYYNLMYNIQVEEK
jgi:hypothetical protein